MTWKPSRNFAKGIRGREKENSRGGESNPGRADCTRALYYCAMGAACAGVEQKTRITLLIPQISAIQFERDPIGSPTQKKACIRISPSSSANMSPSDARSGVIDGLMEMEQKVHQVCLLQYSPCMIIAFPLCPGNANNGSLSFPGCNSSTNPLI